VRWKFLFTKLFYDGEEPPKLPNLPRRKSSEAIAWEVPARMGAFLTSFVACWLKLRKRIGSFFCHMAQKMARQGMAEPQATKG